MLDEPALRAAHELAAHFQVTTSQAIRQAVLAYRDQVKGAPLAQREARLQVLEQLFELFEGNDPDEEVARLKLEDEGF